MFRHFFSREFLVFIIIGTVNTLSTALFAGAFSRLPINAMTAFVLGYAASLVLSFFLNVYFTFKEKPTLIKFLKFPLSYIPNFLIQLLCVWIFVEKLGLMKEIAYLAAAVVGVPATFLVMKLFVFERR